jgi:ribulose 1,5-bisphosphate synthetase/thiazole synthase
VGQSDLRAAESTFRSSITDLPYPVARKMTDIPHVPVIIIGAGFSGLGTAIQLSRLQSFTAYELYEKADFLGGTW